MTTLKGDPGLTGYREFLLDGVPVLRAYWFEKDTRSRLALPMITPELQPGERLIRLLGCDIPEIITDWKP